MSPAHAGLFFAAEKPNAVIATLLPVEHRTVNFHATQWLVLKAR
jgi:hypothetical protein